jgi:hypothetical protein
MAIFLFDQHADSWFSALLADIDRHDERNSSEPTERNSSEPTEHPSVHMQKLPT